MEEIFVRPAFRKSIVSVHIKGGGPIEISCDMDIPFLSNAL